MTLQSAAVCSLRQSVTIGAGELAGELGRQDSPASAAGQGGAGDQGGAGGQGGAGDQGSWGGQRPKASGQ